MSSYLHPLHYYSIIVIFHNPTLTFSPKSYVAVIKLNVVAARTAVDLDYTRIKILSSIWDSTIGLARSSLTVVLKNIKLAIPLEIVITFQA